jgi:hypothetical protein
MITNFVLTCGRPDEMGEICNFVYNNDIPESNPEIERYDSSIAQYLMDSPETKWDVYGESLIVVLSRAQILDVIRKINAPKNPNDVLEKALATILQVRDAETIEEAHSAIMHFHMTCIHEIELGKYTDAEINALFEGGII